ncbi:MAG: hypothetical protein KDH15_19215 [Rhodocyclaceae bacterium]|nr:hypothetical protein [Rhodocyclaceae bacterium]
MTSGRRVALLAAVLAMSPVAGAAEFKSALAAAISYDSPSAQGRKLAIILAGTPVEVIVGLDRWMKVRDVTGSINWVERRLLSDRRTVLVNVDRLVVRSEASTAAPPSFEAERNVVLELIEGPRFGWIKVRHQDGDTGYARAVEVWGL